MSLKDTINNTNKQKENAKTVATQIDNKLVELGGEQAENLSDVANKMEGMVTTQYVKIAEGSYNGSLVQSDNYDQSISAPSLVERIKSIPINLDFTPKRIILNFESIEVMDFDEKCIKLTLDSEFNHNKETAGGPRTTNPATTELHKLKYKIYIKKFSRTSIDLAFMGVNMAGKGQTVTLEGPIKWTAIG